MQVEMKKLLLLGAAVAGLATAQAQITVHPRGEIGVNVSNLSVKVNNKSFDQESKSLADFRVGVAAEIALPAYDHPIRSTRASDSPTWSGRQEQGKLCGEQGAYQHTDRTCQLRTSRSS